MQSFYDLLIVGAGLSGLFAGALAARRGARTLVVARGLGGTHVGPGTIDVWGYAQDGHLAPDPLAAFGQQRLSSPSPFAHPERSGAQSKDERSIAEPKDERSIAEPRDKRSAAQSKDKRSAAGWAGLQHPLGLAGVEALRSALDEIKSLCHAAGYPLAGSLDHNYYLPTALGAVRPTCLAPQSFVAGDVRQPGEISLPRLPGFRDFFADLAAANLNAAGYPARVVDLDLPAAPRRRDAFSTDLARLFDDPDYRAEVARRWQDAVQGVTRLGLPAVLGLKHAAEAHRDLSERLGLHVFEIPILPPSVPGMRLFDILKLAVEAAGGRVTIGPAVRGWVAPGDEADEDTEEDDTGARNGRPGDGYPIGVIAETAGGPRHYQARAVILATGGFRHGGLDAPTRGQARETVFDLPVVTCPQWFAPVYWDAHPYARFGVRVDPSMRPVGGDGQVLVPNLYAVGGLLAGAGRNAEGSREAIDLATAGTAVSQCWDLIKA